MGVPVITLAGRRYVERISATKLTAVGLPELVAQTREDYVERAVRLALDPERLTSMKASLRDRMTRSPLCNTRDLTRALEAAYREMWCRFVSRLN